MEIWILKTKCVSECMGWCILLQSTYSNSVFWELAERKDARLKMFSRIVTNRPRCTQNHILPFEFVLLQSRCVQDLVLSLVRCISKQYYFIQSAETISAWFLKEPQGSIVEKDTESISRLRGKLVSVKFVTERVIVHQTSVLLVLKSTDY